MIDDRAEILALALRAEEDGDLATAITVLEGLVRASPDDARSRTWLGRLYGDRQQFAAAIEMLETAIKLDATRARPYAALAEVLLELGRFGEGERSIRQSISIEPTTSSLVLLGYALGAQSKSLEAEDAFRRALAVDPQNEEAMFNLALELRNRAPDEALALFEAAIRLDPLYSDAHREYGFQLAITGDFARAEGALRTSLEIKEADALSHVYLANTLASTRRFSEAESELTRASILSPLSALSQWGLGKLYEATGRPMEAEHHLRLATQVEPADAEAAFQLGRFLVSVGRPEEARKWLDQTLRLHPTHEQAVELLRSLENR